LYLATERGVSVSTDDGAAWQELKLNLPTVAVTDLVVKDNDLVLGTNGRSVWIFDDLTPLREMTAKLAAEDAHLFPLAPAIRWRYHSAYTPSDKINGDNPPRGAILNYYLKSKPKEPITLEILDAGGKLIRRLGKESIDESPEGDPDGPEEKPKKLELKTEPGVHRVAWDLRFDGPTLIEKAKWDGGEARSGPLVMPGTYTVKLTVDGKSQTAAVEVKPDVRVKLSEAEYREQQQFALGLREDISKVSRTVEQVRMVRRQLADRVILLKDNAKATALRTDAQDLVTKLDALEAVLHNPKAEVFYDILAQRGGAQLYSRLISLYEWSGESDGTPTQGVREVYAEESRTLAERLKEWESLISGPLAEFNAKARKQEVPIILPPPVAETKKKQ
jgi:hypothetical protein